MRQFRVNFDIQTGYDRRVRLCGRCHSWFLMAGARSRFCESCRSESAHALSLPWLTPQDDDSETVADVAAGHVTVP